MRAGISLLLGGLLLATGVTGFRALARRKTSPAKEQVVPPRTAVRFLVVEQGVYQEQIEAYGRARAMRRSKISAEIAGRVVWISPRLEVGAAVTKDEPLVRLDDTDLKGSVTAARARLAQAHAGTRLLILKKASLQQKVAVAAKEHESARNDYDRIKKLVATKVSSKTELDKRWLAVGQIERILVDLQSRLKMLDPEQEQNLAEIAVQSAALARARHDLARAVVSAPYAAQVTARTAQLGQRVGVGAALFELVDNSAVEIPLALPVSRYGDVRRGARAVLRIASARSSSSVRSSTERPHLGQIARIAPEIDTANQTFRAYVQLRGSDGQAAPIPPGAFVHAAVHGRRYEKVISLPRSIFVDDALLVLESSADKPDQAIVRRLTPPIYKRLSDVYLIRDTLTSGTRVVLTNLEHIADGSRVQLIR